MRTAIVAGLLVAGALAPRASHLPPRASQQVFRSGVDGVTVVVSVRSGNKPVAGLTAADFDLSDNGVPQQITSLAAAQVPLDLTLLLDLSSSVDGPTLQRLKAAVTDTAGLLQKDDRIRLVAISQVLHEVFSFRPRGSPMQLDALVAEGATSLYDGIAATMIKPSQPGRRQLIVAFTDGRDSTSILDEKTVKEIARRTDAVVDIVVPVGSVETPETRRVAQRNTIDSLAGAPNVTNVRGAGPSQGADSVPRVLTELVAPTAGQVIPLGVGDSISRGFKAMLDDFRASYVLQYVAQGVRPEGWHEITVAVKKRGRYDIRARKGYMGKGKIVPSEAPSDTHGSARVVWPGSIPARRGSGQANFQVHDGARGSGRDLPGRQR
jgi:VWFA-related protein